MELIFLIVACFAIIFFVIGYGSNKEPKIIKINDDTWFVGDRFVSLGPSKIDTVRQELEDSKVYREYERNRLDRDFRRICNDHTKTLQAINNHPELKDCITEEKLNNITEKYEDYVRICEKHNLLGMYLTKEEFLIKEENPVYCVSFSDIGMCQPMLTTGLYYIHDPKTAKYGGTNSWKELEEDFKKRWY